MRNLKRVLSLTLASVMLLGMMVLGTSAADYTDVDETKHNVEAIDVLTAVGILEGNGDGTLAPDELITREQMAKIMALLMNLNTYITGSNPFNDVSGWAEPYVSACYANGIIKGYGNGVFGAQDNITAVQAASMLMRALGYFQSPADEVDGWELSTIRQAGRIDLFNKVGSTTAGEYLTRNQVAQIVLNTLKSGMVEPNNSNRVNVTVGDAQVAVGASNYEYIVSADASVTYRNAISSEEARNSNGVTGPIIELGEKLYQGDLQLFDSNTRNIDVRDDFGRPAVRWTYKTNEIGTYVDYPTVYKSWTAKVAKNELYSLLGSSNSSDLLSPNPRGNLRVWVDGVEQSVTASNYLDRDNTGAIGGKNAKDIQLGAGKGVLTEVFQDNYNNVTITFTGTYVMQATSDYSTSDNSVRVAVLTRPLEGDFVNENVLKAENFDGLADLGIKADDYLLYTCANGVVETVQKANVVVGEVTAYTLANNDDDYGDGGGSVSLDGNKHDYAKYAKNGAEYGYMVEYKVGANASVVLDAYDYAIYVDDSSLSIGNYVYIYQMASKSGIGDKVEADAFFTDGTRQTITVKKMTEYGKDTNLAYTGNFDGTKPKNSNDAFQNNPGVLVGGWYSYSKNSSGEYTLEKANTTAQFESGLSTTGENLNIDNGRVSIGSKDGNAAGSTITPVTGNSNTIFVVLGKNNKVTVYTGVANVPDIKKANGLRSWYLRTKDQDKRPAIAVFVDASSSKATVRNGNSTLLYILKEASRGRDGESSTRAVTSSGMTYIYDVLIINDEKTQKDQIKTNTPLKKRTVYVSYGIDADGYYELETVDEMKTGYTYSETNDDVIQEVVKQEIDYSNNTLTWGKDKDGNNVAFYMNADSAKHTILLAYPDEEGASGKAGSDLLKSAIIKTGDSFKQYEGVDGKYIADMFKDYYVSGTVYAVRDDDVIKSMIIEVTGIVAKSSSGAGSSNPSSGATGTQTSGEIGVNDLNQMLKEGNVIVTSAFDATNDNGNVNVPTGRTLTFKGDAKFGSSNKLNLQGSATVNVDGTLTLQQNLPAGSTVHATNMIVTAGTNEFGGTVTVDKKLTISAGTVTVSGTLTIGSQGGSGSLVEGSGSIIVTSTSSLHVYGDSKVAITVGADNDSAKNGRVEITGTMSGNFTDNNVVSATVAQTPKQTIKTITGELVLNTASQLTTTNFNPTKVNVVDVVGKDSLAKEPEGAKITLEEGTAKSGVGFKDEDGVDVGQTTEKTDIVVGNTGGVKNTGPSGGDKLTASGGVEEDTTPLFDAEAVFVYDKTTWEYATGKNYNPVQNAVASYKSWSSFLTSNPGAEHGVTTMPWLVVGLKANKTIPTGAVITTKVYKNNSTTEITQKGPSDPKVGTATLTGGKSKGDIVTFGWEIPDTTDNTVWSLGQTDPAGTYKVEFTVKSSAGETLANGTFTATTATSYTAPTYFTENYELGGQKVTVNNTAKTITVTKVLDLTGDDSTVPMPDDPDTTVAEFMGTGFKYAIVLKISNTGSPYGNVLIGYPHSSDKKMAFEADGTAYVLLGVINSTATGDKLTVKLNGKTSSGENFSDSNKYESIEYTVTWSGDWASKVDANGKAKAQ